MGKICIALAVGLLQGLAIGGHLTERTRVRSFMECPYSFGHSIRLGIGYRIVTMVGRGRLVMDRDHAAPPIRFKVWRLRRQVWRWGKLYGFHTLAVSRQALYSALRNEDPGQQTPLEEVYGTLDVIAGDLRESLFSLRLSGRKVYYLSGYDNNESPPLYFLTKLPRSARSIADAREALKPESVRLAEAAGYTIRRQGDIFAVEASGDMPEGFDSLEVESDARVYGTAHRVTEAVTLPDGTLFGRGKISHRPLSRKPDHKPLRLKGWHLLAKNATPMLLPDPPRHPTEPRPQIVGVHIPAPAFPAPTFTNRW